MVLVGIFSLFLQSGQMFNKKCLIKLKSQIKLLNVDTVIFIYSTEISIFISTGIINMYLLTAVLS